MPNFKAGLQVSNLTQLDDYWYHHVPLPTVTAGGLTPINAAVCLGGYYDLLPRTSLVGRHKPPWSNRSIKGPIYTTKTVSNIAVERQKYLKGSPFYSPPAIADDGDGGYEYAELKASLFSASNSVFK